MSSSLDAFPAHHWGVIMTPTGGNNAVSELEKEREREIQSSKGDGKLQSPRTGRIATQILF